MFKDDSFNGISKTYYNSGKLKEEIMFKDGYKNGLHVRYFEKLPLTKRGEKSYVRGVANGLGIGWYPNGRKRVEGNYNGGMLNGLRKTFDDHNKIYKEQYYVNHKPDGPEKSYAYSEIPGLS